jgi:2-keto-4-pentenoate hydratase
LASSPPLGHWRAGTVIEALPDALRPATRAEGHVIQARLEALSAEPLRGWKIAATSTAGHRHIGVDGPLAGRLRAVVVHANGAVLPLGQNRMQVAAVEFAFLMGAELPPRPAPSDTGDVVDAGAALHLAIKVPHARFADFSCVGDGARDRTVREGIGANVLGDPRTALA